MLFINSIGYWSVVYFPTVAAPCRRHLDLHLLQVFVGGVFVAMVLHLAEMAFLGWQHGVNLGVRHSTDLNNTSAPVGKRLLHVPYLMFAHVWALYGREITVGSPLRCHGWWCRTVSSSKAPGWSQSQSLWRLQSPAGQSVRCSQSWSPLRGGGRTPTEHVRGEEMEREAHHWRPFFSTLDKHKT